MLNQLYDVEPSLTTPDYGRAAVNLLARHKKHAMVIVVTIDDGSSSIQVDRVHSVVTYSPEQVEPAPLGTLMTPDGTDLVREVVKTPNDPRVIQILDIDRLLAAAPTSPAA